MTDNHFLLTNIIIYYYYLLSTIFLFSYGLVATSFILELVEIYFILANGLEASGYSAPMRTGRSDRNDGLNIRSGSLDRRKSGGDQRKIGPSKTSHYESTTRTNQSM